MVTIIDYGVGNINAFLNIYKQLNIPAKRATTKLELVGVEKIILPGVGHFDYAMKKFNESGMRDAVENLVLHQSIPVIGVCVGMQMMAFKSEEGSMNGLGWINGGVRKFDAAEMTVRLPLPHMGWNDVSPSKMTHLFKNLENDSRFYFLHSYYFECENAENIAARSTYGLPFSCAVNRGTIYGVQFHPEKSHHFGVQLLKNFAELC